MRIKNGIHDIKAFEHVIYSKTSLNFYPEKELLVW